MMCNPVLRWRQSVWILMIIGALFVSSISNIMFYNSTTSAAPENYSGRPDEHVKVLQYSSFLAQCIHGKNNDDINTKDIINNIFTSTDTHKIGHIADEPDGKMGCKNQDDVGKALNYLGYTNLSALLIEIGCTNKQDDKNKTDVYKCPSVSAREIHKKIIKTMFGDDFGAGFTAADKYRLFLDTFLIGCGADVNTKEIDQEPDIDNGDPNSLESRYSSTDQDVNDHVYKIIEVGNSDPFKKQPVYMKADAGRGKEITTANTIFWDDELGGLGGEYFACIHLANWTEKFADDYQQWAMEHPELAEKAPDMGIVAGDTNDDSDGKSTCDIDGIGWIVCPLMRFISKVADGAFTIIAGLLHIDSDLVSEASGTHTAWAAFRQVANVAFIIAFLVIILSQLSGIGITNYGIKKLLPRLIITAVLVNVSFFLCQIAVDLSEIIGHSLHEFLGTGIPTLMNIQNATPPSTIDMMEGALVTGGVAIAGVVVAVVAVMAISAPVLLAMLLGLLMTLLILLGRKVAIILLIAIAPVAFVAFLLPNTENWFKKWYKMFVGLLMVYPVVSLLYGGGKLASHIIQKAGGGDWFMNLTALAATAMPLIATPFVLKGAMNATGTIGAKLSSLSSKANRRIGSKIKSDSLLGVTASSVLANRNRNRQERLARRTGRNAGTGSMRSRTIDRLGGRDYAERIKRVSAAMESKAFEEDIAASDFAQQGMTHFERMDIADGGRRLAAMGDADGAARARSASEADRVAALRYAKTHSTSKDRENIYKSLSDGKMTARHRKETRSIYDDSGDFNAYGASMDFFDQNSGSVNEAGISNQLEQGAKKKLVEGEMGGKALSADAPLTNRVATILNGGGITTTDNAGVVTDHTDSVRIEMKQRAQDLLDSEASKSFTTAHKNQLEWIASYNPATGYGGAPPIVPA